MAGYFPDADAVYDDTPDAAGPLVKKAQTLRAEQIRRSTEYKSVMAQFKRWASTQRNRDGSVGLRCWRCQQPINYSLQAGDPWSFQTDHDRGVTAHPELATSWTNLRPSHRRCNAQRGQPADDDVEDMRELLGELSEDW